MLLQEPVVKSAPIAYPVSASVKGHSGHDHQSVLPTDNLSFFRLRNSEIPWFQLAEIRQEVKKHVLPFNLWNCHRFSRLPCFLCQKPCHHLMVIIRVHQNTAGFLKFHKLRYPPRDLPAPLFYIFIGTGFSQSKNLFSNGSFFFHIFHLDL